MKVRKIWKRPAARPAAGKRAGAKKGAARPVAALVIAPGPPEESEFDSNPWLGIHWKTEAHE